MNSATNDRPRPLALLARRWLRCCAAADAALGAAVLRRPRPRSRSSIIVVASAACIEPALQDLHRGRLVDDRALTPSPDATFGQPTGCRRGRHPLVRQQHRHRGDRRGQRRRHIARHVLGRGPSMPARLTGRPTTTSTVSCSADESHDFRRCPSGPRHSSVIRSRGSVDNAGSRGCRPGRTPPRRPGPCRRRRRGVRRGHRGCAVHARHPMPGPAHPHERSRVGDSTNHRPRCAAPTARCSTAASSAGASVGRHAAALGQVGVAAATAGQRALDQVAGGEAARLGGRVDRRRRATPCRRPGTAPRRPRAGPPGSGRGSPAPACARRCRRCPRAPRCRRSATPRTSVRRVGERAGAGRAPAGRAASPAPARRRAAARRSARPGRRPARRVTRYSSARRDTSTCSRAR